MVQNTFTLSLQKTSMSTLSLTVRHRDRQTLAWWFRRRAVRSLPPWPCFHGGLCVFGLLKHVRAILPEHLNRFQIAIHRVWRICLSTNRVYRFIQHRCRQTASPSVKTGNGSPPGAIVCFNTAHAATSVGS